MAKKSSRKYSQSESLFGPSLFDSTSDDTFNDEEAAAFEVVAPAKLRENSGGAPVSHDEITAESAVRRDTSLRFISFGSGSSGNCAYIGTPEGEGILIDAGVDDKIVYGTLAKYGITPYNIKGICLTHDHGDHIRYAYKLVKKYRHIGVYCTPRVLDGIFRRHSISRSLRERHVPIFKEIPFKTAGLEITAFEVPHDGSDNAGFFIEYEGMKFVIATDIGNIASRARNYLSQADFMMLESNYNEEMLTNGSYPEYLKSRIRGANGHLENEVGARFIAEVYRGANAEKLSYLFLCHLSKDNNTPECAVEAYHRILSEAGIRVGEGKETLEDRECDIQLVALPRYEPTRLYLLRK